MHNFRSGFFVNCSGALISNQFFVILFYSKAVNIVIDALIQIDNLHGRKYPRIAAIADDTDSKLTAADKFLHKHILLVYIDVFCDQCAQLFHIGGDCNV